MVAHHYSNAPLRVSITMSSVPGNKVIVVGCGIAGPVLAMFLKNKGYDPILYDRLEGPQTAGLSLMYVVLSLRDILDS